MKAKIQTIVLGVLAITMVACSSSKKLLKNGDFDASIVKAIKNVRGGGDRAKVKHLTTLGEAFYKANQLNLIAIKSLKKQKRVENWIEINVLYNKIIERQNLVAPYVQDALELGIDVRSSMADYYDEELDSRKRAAFFLYEKASEEMAEARNGDKLSARRAYNRYTKIDRYFDKYKEKEALKREAIDLGQDAVFVEIVNKSQAIIPRRLGDKMLDFGVENLNDIFHQYYVNPVAGMAFDYNVKINILDMIITPESERIESYEETKEVADGFDYVLDSNGNVQKDSAGNDIKIDRFKTIKATVEEIRQFKAVALTGNVEYYDMNGNRVLRTEPIKAEAVFENIAGRFIGEREALTEESRRKIGNAPISFPSNEMMLEDAVDLMRPIILRSIQNIKAS